MLGDYYRWRQDNPRDTAAPRFFDFMTFGPLCAAEKTFYAVGVTVPEARAVAVTVMVPH